MSIILGMENIREIISNNITNLRKQHNMTQLDLAKKVNFSDKAVSRWEKGEVMPDVETLYMLAEIFNVPISCIIENQETLKPKLKKPTAKEVLSQVLTICEIWTIIAVVFAYHNITRDKIWWELFVWGVPATAFFLLLLNRKRDDNISKFVYGTILVWSFLICVFLHFLSAKPWYIFVIGIPLQGMLIIRHLFNYKQESIIKTKKIKAKDAKKQKEKKK